MANVEQSAPAARAPLRLLLRIHLLQTWRQLRSVHRQSRLLVSLIGLFILGYASLSYWLFWKGLKFISTFPGLGGMLTERLLYLLFALLFLLLWLSNLVISYGNLFRNRETFYLLSLPISPQVIFQWKFIESTLLASWAFLFLIAPLLVAYGLTSHAPWHFYLATPALIFLFTVLPAVAGAAGAMVLARYLDRRRFQWLALGSALALLIGVIMALKPTAVSDEMLETRVLEVLDRLLVRTRFSQYPLLPSYWLAASVLHWSEGVFVAAGFFALVLLSHTLFFGYLAFFATGRIYYEAFSAVHSRGKIFGRGATDRAAFHFGRGPVEVVFSLLRWVRTDIQAFLIKDTRMFWRDTTQWGQTLVLFGLLGVYILNLRHFSRQLANPFWVNLVSHLNLMACALNLATLTTRFVFPQFSLEGKRLWLVGMAPLGLKKILQAKFWLASTVSFLLTAGLMALSSHMLQISWDRSLFFIGAVSVMAFTLSALAIGLGTLYPNFKEENPSKIVSGFGGTFCLVLSFLYIVGAVAILAIGSAWSGAWMNTDPDGPEGMMALSWGVFGLWSLVFGGIPYVAGLRRIETVEW